MRFVGVFLAFGTLEVKSANLVQAISFNLTANQGDGAKTLKITTRDVIRYFTQTNVPGARLLLVTPDGNAPGTIDNLNAFLRVARGNEVILDVTSPDQFNFFQDSAALHVVGTHTISRAINRFSIDSGGFKAELQGFSTWNINQKLVDGVDVSGTGAFVSSVNGVGSVDGVTTGSVTMHGTVTAGPPKPEE